MSSSSSDHNHKEVKQGKAKPGAHQAEHSKTDQDITGNEEAELQLHTDHSKVALAHQHTPTDSDSDDDKNDSLNHLGLSKTLGDSKEGLAFGSPS